MSFDAMGINDWLAQTKFYIPSLNPDVVTRPRLYQKIHQILAGKQVALISAQAGYGKTTLLASLPALLPELNIAWMALDESDNDWVQFLAGFNKTLQQLEPAFGNNIQALLDSLASAGPGLEMRQVIAILINEVIKTIKGSFAVVLDDLHNITEPVIFQGLDFLIERMPPNMHLLIGTRHEPPLALARWRARGKLLEIGEADLRFSGEETRDFLNQYLKLNLAEPEIAALQTRTEGWVAGLRLLTTSLEQMTSAEDRLRLINELSKTSQYVYEFLAEEVLNIQDGITRRFLLETSILPELTPALCETVTGRDNARTLLEEIYRRNLCTQVDRNLNTYRYHDLFAEFLQQRLNQDKPGRVAELHRRAAEVAQLPSRAIHHYLAGHWWEDAANKTEQVGRRMLYQGLYESLQSWIGALPTEILENHPRLLFLLGMCSWGNGNIPESYPFFERAAAGFELQGATDEQWEALYNLANNLIGEHRLDEAEAYFEKINSLPVSFDTRVLTLMMYAWFYLWKRDRERAAVLLDEALLIGLETQDPLAIHVLAHNYRLFFINVPGGLARTRRFCLELSSFKEKNYFLRASINLFEGYYLYLQGHLAEGLARLKHVQAINQEANLGVWIKVDYNLIAWAMLQGSSDTLSLDQHMEDFVKPLSRLGSAKNWQFLTDYLFGRHYFEKGQLEKLRELCDNWPARTDYHYSLFDARLVKLLTRAQLAITEGLYPEAETLLKEALEFEIRLEALFTFVSAHTLLSHLYILWNKPQKALEVLEPILAEGERLGWPGFLLHDMHWVVPALRLAVEQDVRGTQAARILQLLGENGNFSETGAVTTLTNPPKEAGNAGLNLLSNRELEVLKLLSEGLNTRQVASKLIVSELTVKSHVSHIFQKLDTNTRIQAISRARELGLIR